MLTYLKSAGLHLYTLRSKEIQKNKGSVTAKYPWRNRITWHTSLGERSRRFSRNL